MSRAATTGLVSGRFDDDDNDEDEDEDGVVAARWGSGSIGLLACRCGKGCGAKVSCCVVESGTRCVIWLCSTAVEGLSTEQWAMSWVSLESMSSETETELVGVAVVAGVTACTGKFLLAALA